MFKIICLPLWLLHGDFGAMGDFATLLPRLQAHFHLVAMDTRGHGRSTFGVATLTYAQVADDLRHILRHLGIGRYHLFGGRFSFKTHHLVEA